MITAQQLHMFNVLYLAILVIVAVLTRATARRIAGALAGMAVMYPLGLAIIALGERVGWWHWKFPWEPNFLTALGINCLLCAFVFLITWRIARRFGGRGLAVVAVVAAVIGPTRDKSFVERYPEWGSFASLPAPHSPVRPPLGAVLSVDRMILIILRFYCHLAWPEAAHPAVIGAGR